MYLQRSEGKAYGVSGFGVSLLEGQGEILHLHEMHLSALMLPALVNPSYSR